jgi:hypothetical protein
MSGRRKIEAYGIDRFAAGAAWKILAPHDNTRLTAGPPDLRNLVPDLAVIPAQKSRDLLDREAAHEHIAQLGQLRIRPFPFRVHGRLFVLNGGALRIDDRGPNNAE